jgi:ketosteroid isomerase-like protein
MSQENVEVVKRGIAAYNSRDINAVYELATPDFEWVPAIVAMIEGESVQGRDGMERYFQEIADTWEDYRLAIDEFRDLGSSVLALGRIEARGLGSGAQVDTSWGAIFEFRGGLMSHARAYLDCSELLRAAGLTE